MSLEHSKTKMHFKILLKPAVLILIVLILPTTSEKSHQETNVNQSNNNSINKRMSSTSSSGDGDDDSELTSTMSGCRSCKMREEIKNISLKIIKDKVLVRMGFHSAPNMTGRILPQVPPHYLAMFEQQQQGYSGDGMQSDEPQQSKTGFTISEEIDEYHIKTEKVLSFAQPYPRLRHSWKGYDILHFSFSDRITRYQVSDATLYVYIKGVDRSPLPDVLIEIFKVKKLPEHQDSPDMKWVATEKVAQPLGKGDWVKINLTETVSEWFKNPRENVGFVINRTVNGKKIAVTETSMDEGNKAPFVEIVTTESKRRTRRSGSLNCDDQTNERLCCRYPLTVDFEEFGWDFIIAPKKYEAHYCSGECPFITLQKHAHTHLVQLTSPHIAPPCCTPKKLSAINMLYFDQELNVVYGSLPGMVVDRCGCS